MSAQRLVGDRRLDRPVDQVHQPALVVDLDQPVLRRLLGREADRGQRRQRPFLVLLADQEVDVVVAGVPAVGVHREAAAERERDLGLLERGGHPLERGDQALVHPVRHGDLPGRWCAVCAGNDYPSRPILHTLARRGPRAESTADPFWYAYPVAREPCVARPGTVVGHGSRPHARSAPARPRPPAHRRAGRHRRLRQDHPGAPAGRRTRRRGPAARPTGATPAAAAGSAGSPRALGRARRRATCSAAALMLVVESVLRWLAILRTLLRRSVTGEIAVMDRYAVCQYASLRAHGARPGRRSAAPGWPTGCSRSPDVTFLLAVDPAGRLRPDRGPRLRPRGAGVPARGARRPTGRCPSTPTSW